MNHNLLVGQSGGPTAVINGSLYGVVSEGLANPEIDNVIGMVNGIEGFLADHTIDMAPLKENGELERIRTTPGSYLGSCRYKLPENLSDPVYIGDTIGDFNACQKAGVPFIFAEYGFGQVDKPDYRITRPFDLTEICR